MPDLALAAKDIYKSFGGVHALNGVSLTINAGDLIGLMGPNGSGKSTFVNCVSGYAKPDRGTISSFARDITGLGPHNVFKFGIARTFQTIRVYGNMSVYQNLSLPLLVTNSLESKEASKRIDESMQMFNLTNLRDTIAKSLSLYDQRKLEIATRVVSKPKLLLLDEPAGGLSESEVDTLMENLRTLQKNGITLLVVEHTMKVIFALANRVIVFDQGSVIADGAPNEILNEEHVIEAYLGEGFRKK